MNANTKTTEPKNFAELINDAESYLMSEMSARDASVARFRDAIADENRSLRAAAEWEELEEAAVDQAIAHECQLILEMFERIYDEEHSTEAAYEKMIENLDHDIGRETARVISNASIRKPDLLSLRVAAKIVQLMGDVRRFFG